MRPGRKVLDVAAGSGNAAIPAARVGAEVVAADLTPELLERGKAAAEAEGVKLEWREADAEAMPFDDDSFDVTLSCVGVMFAPHHQASADEMVRVFRRLFETRFPIKRMRLVDRYGADDKRSMAANNTSAFNCRWRGGVCCRWSQHAYGKALDLNPVQNPFIWSGGVSPPAGRNYLDRSDRRRGMVFRRDRVWWAFRAAGWEWGGDWSGEKDYQHFSANGH